MERRVIIEGERERIADEQERMGEIQLVVNEEGWEEWRNERRNENAGDGGRG